MRNEWDTLLAEASLVAQAMEIPAQFQSEDKQTRKRKRMPDESCEEISHSTTVDQKSENPLNPDYVPSLFAYLTPEQRQRKIKNYSKFEQTQAIKRSAL